MLYKLTPLVQETRNKYFESKKHNMTLRQVRISKQYSINVHTYVLFFRLEAIVAGFFASEDVNLQRFH